MITSASRLRLRLVLLLAFTATVVAAGCDEDGPTSSDDTIDDVCTGEPCVADTAGDGEVTTDATDVDTTDGTSTDGSSTDGSSTDGTSTDGDGCDDTCCGGVSEYFYCDAPEADVGTIRCLDATTASSCDMTEGPDCINYGVWTNAACAAGEVCLDGAGCVPRTGCQSDAECGGGECVAVGPQYSACTAPIAEVTECTGGGIGLDACCASTECADGEGGACVTGPLLYCGGAAPQPANECFYDTCTRSAECTDGDNGICVPGDVWGLPTARCAYGSTCTSDVDCGDEAGGQCVPFFAPCAGGFTGFHCTYETSACRSDADCADGPGGSCQIDQNGDPACVEFMPPP